MIDMKQIENIKNNELQALYFIEIKDYKNAEKILLENVLVNTNSCLTYNLLIKIYNNNNDFSSLINILNCDIKNTQNKLIYKKLKKQIILSKFRERIINNDK